ncbi:MAG: hypothetical protein WC516_07145 [Patescibacteria group bacterium]|jgi:hypothetical protein
MKIQAMTEIELVLLRNWMCEIYNTGKGFVGVSQSQLIALHKKLEELDTELLKRVLDDGKSIASFVDENFDETLKQIRADNFTIGSNNDPTK